MVPRQPLLGEVLATIGFHRQAPFGTEKVQDVPAHLILAADLCPTKVAVAQKVPKNALCICS